MNKFNHIWVFSEKNDLLKSLCSGAYAFAEKVSVIFVGSKSDAVFGDHVYYLGDTADRMAEDYIPTIIEMAKTEKPDAIFVGISRTGRLVAGAVATALETSVLTDVSELSLNETLIAKRMVYGGSADLTATATGTVVVGIKEGTFGETQLPDPASVIDVEFVEPSNKIRVTGRIPKTAVRTNLAGAKNIICVGRGFLEKEDLHLAYDLAEKIGGEVGCTRPVTEDDGWMDKNLYIGISGQMLNPELYIGIGISGQVQHMVGVNSAKTVIAINKDERASIFDQCDYGYVGDLKVVLPLLIEKFR